MPVSSGNTNAVQQNNASANNGSQQGIAFKSPLQQKSIYGEEELLHEPMRTQSCGNAQAVPPFNPRTVPVQQKANAFAGGYKSNSTASGPPVQLKETGMYLNAASDFTTPRQVVQRIKLSNGDDTDNYTFGELEEMVNDLKGHKLTEDDADLIYAAMDKINGGAPAAMDYVGSGEGEDDDDYSDHEFFNFDTIPQRQFQEADVNHKFYRFWNDGERCLEFTQPKDKKNPDGSTTAATAVAIVKRVNIKKGNKIEGFPDQPLKQPKKKNYWHFKAANTLAGLKAVGTSPDGYTWHHHRTEGQMELLDRDVHAAFKHAGGKKYWGTA